MEEESESEIAEQVAGHADTDCSSAHCYLRRTHCKGCGGACHDQGCVQGPYGAGPGAFHGGDGPCLALEEQAYGQQR
ncbi:hypothetical protein [Streptomyces sp. PT12]|uniref:hypothetical protein n=1 Tax=Streptomyces sp. PT12 TaxID=1510197 RepID=UPI0011BF2467|nr:hypothetical protein [Streptomyces sp. PT12]